MIIMTNSFVFCSRRANTRRPHLASDGRRNHAEVLRCREVVARLRHDDDRSTGGGRHAVAARTASAAAAAGRVAVARRSQTRRRVVPRHVGGGGGGGARLAVRRRRRRPTTGQQARDGPRHRLAVVDVVQLRPAEELAEDGRVARRQVVEVGDAAAQHERVGRVRVDQRPVVDGRVVTKEVEVCRRQDDHND